MSFDDNAESGKSMQDEPRETTPKVLYDECELEELAIAFVKDYYLDHMREPMISRQSAIHLGELCFAAGYRSCRSHLGLTLTPSPETTPKSGLTNDDGLWEKAVNLADQASDLHFTDEKGRNSYAAEKYRIGFRDGYLNATNVRRLTLTAENVSPDDMTPQENPEITKERNRLFVRKVDELNEALRLKTERIAELENELAETHERVHWLNERLNQGEANSLEAAKRYRDLEAKLAIATEALKEFEK